MRSPTNVLESLKSKACNRDYRYERLYRNLYNPEFYLLAYQSIYAKEGNLTAGTDGLTIDGMSTKRIDTLIASLKDFPQNLYRQTGQSAKKASPGYSLFQRQTVAGSYPNDIGKYLRGYFLHPFPRIPTAQELPHGTSGGQKEIYRGEMVR